MLLRTITESTPLERFRNVEKVLTKIGGSVAQYKNFDADRLTGAIRLEEQRANGLMRTGNFHSCMQDPEYGKARLTVDALKALREYKIERDGAVELIEGLTYYRGIAKQEARGRTYVAGERCTYLGEDRPAEWVAFCDSERKLKVLEMLRHGSDSDFTTMYLTMADGRPIDAQNGFVVEHLTESTDEALDLMEEYSDSRWTGPWPWDMGAPKKLRDRIKGERQMRNSRIVEMRNRFREVYRELMEGEIEQAKVIEAGREFAEEVQGMIEDLGKASGEILVNLRDKTRTEFGEESAHQLEQSCSAQIGIAVDALSALRTAVEKQMETLEHSIGQQPGMGGMGGGGMPGADPMDAHAADAMAGAGAGAGDPSGMPAEPGAAGMDPGMPGPEGEREKR